MWSSAPRRARQRWVCCPPSGLWSSCPRSPWCQSPPASGTPIARSEGSSWKCNAHKHKFFFCCADFVLGTSLRARSDERTRRFCLQLVVSKFVLALGAPLRLPKGLLHQRPPLRIAKRADCLAPSSASGLAVAGVAPPLSAETNWSQFFQWPVARSVLILLSLRSRSSYRPCIVHARVRNATRSCYHT